MFIDTHCHIFPEYYDDINDLMKYIKDNKIIKIINNGTDLKSNKIVLEMIKKYDSMYGAIGIHPEVVEKYSSDDLSFVEKHIKDDKIVALGEIGLDYHYSKENKDKQIELFEKQLEIAQKYDVPVIVHSRDATLDTIESLKKFKIKGVIHSFSGSYETAMIYIKMGFLIGINGVVTFKNCNLIDVLKKIPLENVVFETDSPYLTPVPYRGQQNNPSHVMDTAKFVAEKLNIDIEKLSDITMKNVKRVFDI